MRAMDAVRGALGFADQGVGLLETMKDKSFVQPGSWGGNHALWILGHVTVAEGRLHKIPFGTLNPVERWKPLFDWGSEPTTDPAASAEQDARVSRRDRRRRAGSADENGAPGP